MSDMLTRVTLDLTLTELGRTLAALTTTADAYRDTARSVLGILPSGTGERTNRYWLQLARETETLRDRLREAWARGPMVAEDGPTALDEAEHATALRAAVRGYVHEPGTMLPFGSISGPTQIEAE